MFEVARGALSKMATQLDAPVQYAFRLGDEQIAVNPMIGKTVRLEFLGAIHCSHCGRKTKTSFSQGYCYPCMQKLAQCDLCIMSPERCHYDAGTCRDPAWGEQFCMTDHVVYLANSSGIKVGITRATQIPTRWIDQGATQALPIMRVATRQQSGFVEDLLRSQVADKTNWRALLKGDAAPVDLLHVREQIFDACAGGITTPCKSASACRPCSRSTRRAWWRSVTRSRAILPRSPASTWTRIPSPKARCWASRAST